MFKFRRQRRHIKSSRRSIVTRHRSAPRHRTYNRLVPLRSRSSSRSSRSSSQRSQFSARSRSRTPSPRFPKSHYRKSLVRHGRLDQSIVPSSYHISAEISKLAAQFLRNHSALPPLDLPACDSWPTTFPNLPVFAISINASRQKAFMQRFPHAQIWAGTNGRSIDVARWYREGRIASMQLTRGEVGCADSHLRLLRHIVKHSIERTIICEDDVNLSPSPAQMRYLNCLLSEVSSTPCDLLFLSWFRPFGGLPATNRTRLQWTFCQLWAFMITLEGAKKLLADRRVVSISEPIDVAYFSAHCRGTVRNLVACPPLCVTVGCASDTHNIK